MEKNSAPPPYTAYPNQPPPAGFMPPPTMHMPPPTMHMPPSNMHMPPQQQSVTTVIIEPSRSYGPESQSVVCPHCRQQIRSVVETEATTKTHLYALILCLVGCWPCVCLPYCMDSCQNRNHYCPNCKAYLGAYQS